MKKALMLGILPLFQTLVLSGWGPESTQRVLAPNVQAPASNRSANSGPEWSAWSEPVSLGPVVNSASRELGPELSPDGLSLVFGSDRAGGLGGIDLWVSRRACHSCPWQAPVNLGPNINSSTADGAPGFSPDGHLLFFSSARDGGQGGEDIWVSHRANKWDDLGWEPPVNLGAMVNTAEGENGPMFLPGRKIGRRRNALYFVRAGDIYQVAMTRRGKTFGPAVAVAELNEPGVIDNDPSVRRDGRELFFWSARQGGVGLSDIWVSTRPSVRDSWSAPQSLGLPINTPGADLTPTLSREGRTLIFSVGANARPTLGLQDLWMSTRTRLHGADAEDDGDDDDDEEEEDGDARSGG
jgi:hypothetical protein